MKVLRDTLTQAEPVTPTAETNVVVGLVTCHGESVWCEPATSGPFHSGIGLRDSELTVVTWNTIVGNLRGSLVTDSESPCQAPRHWVTVLIFQVTNNVDNNDIQIFSKNIDWHHCNWPGTEPRPSSAYHGTVTVNLCEWLKWTTAPPPTLSM